MRVTVCGDMEMEHFAAEFAAALQPRAKGATVVALSGDLGAGKTTFARGVLRSFGVTKIITSPTFVIEKIYTPSCGLFAKIVHVDAYRLQNARELETLGFSGLLKDQNTLILIEWPERVGSVLPKYAKRLRFAFGEGAERTISYDD